MASVWGELRRRNVGKVAVAYVVVGWLLIEAADLLLENFGAPDWVVKAFTILVFLGFPLALIFAWAFDLTPSGVKRTTSIAREDNHGLLIDTEPDVGMPQLSQVTRSTESWIAVMPFKIADDDAEMAGFADGLAEDISGGLSRFPYLAVISRESTLKLAGHSIDVREFGTKLGARFVIEGSARRADNSVRVSVRLIDGTTGAGMWAENYTRNLADSDLFTAEDEISDRVVATVADGFGVLVDALIVSIADKPESDLTANDWVLRTFEYLRHYLPEPHARVRAGLEQAAKKFPRNAEVLACLSQLYLNEQNFGFNAQPGSLDRALDAASRALELNGASQLANQMLAQVYFFRRDLERFRPTAKRAISLNTLDTNTLGILGLLTAHTGEFEDGVKITQRAMDLNANHAHWCHFSWIWYHFSKGEYEQALECVSRVNIPGNFWIPLATAAIYGHLGREAEGRAAVADLLEVAPDIAAHARANIEAWHYGSGLMEPLLQGLAKSGLEVQ